MWAAAIPAIMQGISSMMQMSDAQDKLNTQRPDYNIPESVKQALTIARTNYADQTMPGENRMLDQNNLAAGNAMKSVTAAGGPLSAVAGIQAQQSKQAGDILTRSAMYQKQDEKAYQQMLQMMGEYNDQQWQMNKFAPYQQAYQEGRQEFGAGMQNLYGSLDSIANVIMANQIGNQDPAALARSATADANQSLNLNNAYQSMMMKTSQPAIQPWQINMITSSYR